MITLFHIWELWSIASKGISKLQTFYKAHQYFWPKSQRSYCQNSHLKFWALAVHKQMSLSRSAKRRICTFHTGSKLSIGTNRNTWTLSICSVTDAKFSMPWGNWLGLNVFLHSCRFPRYFSKLFTKLIDFTSNRLYLTQSCNMVMTQLRTLLKYIFLNETWDFYKDPAISQMQRMLPLGGVSYIIL